MNALLSGLLVFAIVLVAYLLVSRWYSGAQTSLVKNAVQLKTGSLGAVTSLTYPTASIFTFTGWIYVNTWTNAGGSVLSFGPAGSAASGGDWRIDLGTTSPQLNVVFNDATTTAARLVTNNLPVQRWNFLAFVVSGLTVDCYLNGRLVNTYQLAQVPAYQSTQMNYGSGLDVGLANLQRLPNQAYSPDQIEAQYFKYQQSMQSVSYGMRIDVTQNDAVTSQWKLF